MIQRILILENHSAFISCKRALEAGYNIFSYQSDTLIYGQGKHIIDSFKFLNELINTGKKDNSQQIQQIEVRYAGDIDPEGWLIYYKLKEKYPDISINLFTEYYQQMIRLGSEKAYQIKNKQHKNNNILRKILTEFESQANVKSSMISKIKLLWNDDMRLPQELITYEVLTKDV
ncbi:MAG: Wadjet anti-phage system protein JetD domain-containing protein [Halothermotrichaceae bacterium]